MDQSQYQLYVKGQLDIYSPDAMLLESIGESVNKAEAETHRYKLHDQLSLVESLVINSNGHLELTERASAGLAELLFQSQQMLR